jgi:hypothetical protein
MAPVSRTANAPATQERLLRRGLRLEYATLVASAVVVWQLKGTAGDGRDRRALRVIAVAFALLALYIAAQAAHTLLVADHPGTSAVGIAWLALTVAAMLALAAAKRATGDRLGKRVLATEARVTLFDGALAAAVLLGVVLNAAAGWWWAGAVAVFIARSAWRAGPPGTIWA